MRAVLDANVLISAVISARGAPARLLALWQEGRYDLVLSPTILEELGRVLRSPRIKECYRLREEEIELTLNILRTQALMVDPEEAVNAISADPSDNRYLACALAGGAAYVVSGDAHLLDLGEYRGMAILAPVPFLALLELENRG